VSKTQEVDVEQLSPGNRLARDIMVEDSVLLRSGAVLTQANITRLKQLGTKSVLIEPALVIYTPATKPAAEPAEIEQLNYKKHARDGYKEWMADAKFHQAVEITRRKTREEELFSNRKDEFRATAGLVPLIDSDSEASLTRNVHAAFISSATRGKVDLERLESIAVELANTLCVTQDGYIKFTDTPDYLPFSDVSKYGEVLAARTMMSSKLYTYAQPPSSSLPADEQLKAHLALCNGYALMPIDELITGAGTDDHWQNARRVLLDYYSWLRSQRFVSEVVLEQLLLRTERYDGRGLPYGLQREMIPAASQSWSMVWHYSSKLFSKPNQERISPHAAGDLLVRESDKTFSSASVNGFLKRLGLYPVGTPVKLSDGRLALVVNLNKDALLKPVIRLFDHESGIGGELNLVEEPTLFISDAVLEF
jgi:hypothetical protein